MKLGPNDQKRLNDQASTTTRVLSATAWRTNAELIAAIAPLYLTRDMHTVDVTYGNGKWWTLWRPDQLVAHDLDPTKGDGVDFTALPEADATYDLAAFDPPYVATGGRTTQGAAGVQMAHAFGMSSSGATPADNQALIDAGLAELYRVLRPVARSSGRPRAGVALVKCQNYITSGRLWPGVPRTIAAAEAQGFRLEDIIEHLSAAGGPQPQTNPDGTPRRQMHTKRNNTTLLVLTKGPKP